MGINKLPETGHTQLLPRPRERETKRPLNAKQAANDKLSVRGIALKYSVDKDEKFPKVKDVKGSKLNVTSFGEKVSDRTYGNPGLHWGAKDVISGDAFSRLARKSFEKGRPYCFAVAIATDEKTTEKKKIFMDGSNFLESVDMETFKIPCSVMLGADEKAEFLHDVHFFAVRENNQTEEIGSISEAAHGPNSIILEYLIRQEDNETYKSEGYITNVVIASAYSLGVGVKKDEEYAKEIMEKIDKVDRACLSPELFSVALVSGHVTHVTEFLLRNGFDPNVRDPYELCTSIQMADHHENKEMLRTFARYGYHL